MSLAEMVGGCKLAFLSSSGALLHFCQFEFLTLIAELVRFPRTEHFVRQPRFMKKNSNSSRLSAALDGVSAAIPFNLGTTTLIYASAAPSLLGMGVFATMVGMAVMLLLTCSAKRPIFYCGRLFEAAALASMVTQFTLLAPAWGLQATEGIRLAYCCAIMMTAAVFVMLLHAVRAGRLVNFIPAPVFTGFVTGVAALIATTQLSALWRLQSQTNAIALWSIALGTLAVGVAVRLFRPRWPASGIAMVSGLLQGLAWQQAGVAVVMVSSAGVTWTLPVLHAEVTELVRGVQMHGTLLMGLVMNGGILGVMLFLSTVITTRTVTLVDHRQGETPGDKWLMSLGMLICGAIGSAPMSGSPTCSLSVMRSAPLTARVLIAASVMGLAIYAFGVLSWLAVAAVAGGMLCEAWIMFDRTYLHNLKKVMRRQILPRHAGEDTALITAVVITSCFANMVVALVLGLLLGLVMYAARNSKKPIRAVFSGVQLKSNCARSQIETTYLHSQGHRLCVIQLDGDLFFAVDSRLDREVVQLLDASESVVLDWGRVRDLDSSVARTIGKWHANAHATGRHIFNAKPKGVSQALTELLQAQMPNFQWQPDLDRALEAAEDLLLSKAPANAAHQTIVWSAASCLLRNLSAQQKAQVENLMVSRLYKTGDYIFRIGEASDRLVVLQHGSADVLLDIGFGENIRPAGFRRGALVGEIGFLDGSKRSADVFAVEDVMTSELSFKSFQRITSEAPELAMLLLRNIALEMGGRLRHSNTASAQTILDTVTLNNAA